jgi:pyrroline-5-carboxylate reductase
MARLTILGCGTMGRAILAGLKAVPDAPQVSAATARRAKAREALAARFGDVVVTADNAEAIRHGEVVLLATKPQGAREVLTTAGVAEALKGMPLISICAGVNTTQLSRWAPGAHVIRAMPNTPCLIREGMTVLSPGNSATEEDIALATSIFEAVGRVRVLGEKHLDAVTGLSGSGPAFACVILEALADGGVRMGLPRDVAVELAAQTFQGAARMVLQTGKHPAELKDEVTTPAGCTIAGLLTMEDGKIRSVIARTIEEATRTASGLGQE